jgi:ribose 5-phosphate isomerase B
MGCHSDESCHYPLFASAVAEAVAANPDTTFGILICGTGIGMSMCANKYRGVRAALCTNTFMGEMTRAHNNANVLCMGARVLQLDTAKEIMAAFLATPFDGGRHQTRLDIIAEVENKNFK